MIDPSSSLPYAQQSMGAPNPSSPNQQSTLMQLLAMLQAQSTAVPGQTTTSAQQQADNQAAAAKSAMAMNQYPVGPGAQQLSDGGFSQGQNTPYFGGNSFMRKGANGENYVQYSQPTQGGGYGMAANSANSGISPQDMDSIKQQAQSAQFEQLIKGLLNDKNLFKSPAPTASSFVTPTGQVTPLSAPVPNNQVSYTDPTKAAAPGMGQDLSTLPVQSNIQAIPNATPGMMPSMSNPTATLPAMTTTSDAIQSQAGSGQMTPLNVPPTMAPALSDQLQKGMSQKDIMKQGGPLQASTDSGITPGSMPTPVAQPGPASRSYSSNPFSTQTPITLPSQTPSAIGTTQNLGPVDGSKSMIAGGANYAQGGLDAATGANATALTPGGANYAAGGLDSTGDYGASGGAASVGGGSGAAMGGAIASGIGQIGAALQKAYTPIKLGPIQQVQQPKSPVFGIPMMTPDR